MRRLTRAEYFRAMLETKPARDPRIDEAQRQAAHALPKAAPGVVEAVADAEYRRHTHGTTPRTATQRMESAGIPRGVGTFQIKK